MLSNLCAHQILLILGLRFSTCNTSDSFYDIVARSIVNAKRLDRSRVFYLGTDEDGNLINITNGINPLIEDLDIEANYDDCQFLVDTFKKGSNIPTEKVGVSFLKNSFDNSTITSSINWY